MKPSHLILALLLLSSLIWSCSGPQKQQTEKMDHPKTEKASPTISARKSPSFRGLYDRIDGEIVDASEADVALANTYWTYDHKGPLKNGKRLTLLSHSSEVKAGTEVRILHFYEVVDTESELYIMGPKTVYGEYINGEQQGPKAPVEEYPWMVVYDGAVLDGPEVDYNFEISKYTFEQPGEYRIQWKIEGLESNVVVVTVK
jgi:hypothetical protein